MRNERGRIGQVPSALAAAATSALLLAGFAVGCSDSTTSSPSSGGGSTSVTTPSTEEASARTGATLPATIQVPLDVVQQSFPDITRIGSAGVDETAIAEPIATWSTAYVDETGDKKVTLSVSQYATVDDAKAAYAVAVQASRDAPGFELVDPPVLGEEAFAGTSRVGDERHFGLGGRDDRLIVAATHAGFPITPANSAAVIELANDQLSRANQTLGPLS